MDNNNTKEILEKYKYKVIEVSCNDTVEASDLKTVKYWNKGQYYKANGYSFNGTYSEGIGSNPEECLCSFWIWCQHFDRETIADEIETEVSRQNTKWGESNHPSVDMVLANRIKRYDDFVALGERLCEEYEIPSEARAKLKCETAFKKNEGTWAHIAIEELSEAVAAENDTDRRAELVQLAAVIINWIQSIDRSIET